MKRDFKTVTISIAIFIATMTLLTGCASLLPAEDEMLPIPVPTYTELEYKTINPVRGSIIKKLSVFGIAGADYINETGQYFAVNGYLSEITVKDGQYVEQDEILATLSVPDKKTAIDEEYSDALNDYINIQNAYQSSNATKYELRAAEIRYEHAKEKYDELVVYMQSLELKADKAGYVTSIVNLSLGDPVGKSIMICRVADSIEKKVSSSATASNIQKLKYGQAAIFKSGEVEYICYVSSLSGTTVEFKSDNMEHLQNGDIVQVYIILEQVDNVLVIPRNVVMFTDDNTGSIRVLQDNAPVTVNIKLGLMSESEVEILPGQDIDESTLIIGGSR